MRQVEVANRVIFSEKDYPGGNAADLLLGVHRQLLGTGFTLAYDSPQTGFTRRVYVATEDNRGGACGNLVGVTGMVYSYTPNGGNFKIAGAATSTRELDALEAKVRGGVVLGKEISDPPVDKPWGHMYLFSDYVTVSGNTSVANNQAILDTHNLLGLLGWELAFPLEMTSPGRVYAIADATNEGVVGVGYLSVDDLAEPDDEGTFIFNLSASGPSARAVRTIKDVTEMAVLKMLAARYCARPTKPNEEFLIPGKLSRG